MVCRVGLCGLDGMQLTVTTGPDAGLTRCAHSGGNTTDYSGRIVGDYPHPINRARRINPPLPILDEPPARNRSFTTASSRCEGQVYEVQAGFVAAHDQKRKAAGSQCLGINEQQIEGFFVRPLGAGQSKDSSAPERFARPIDEFSPAHGPPSDIHPRTVTIHTDGARRLQVRSAHANGLKAKSSSIRPNPADFRGTLIA
jgi:hypothetical protein